MKKMRVVTTEDDGEDLFLVLDGERIARRGHPNTPEARTWVSLKPGYVVKDIAGGEEVEIVFNGQVLH